MATSRNKSKLANLEGAYTSNRRFERVEDLWTRYKSLKDNTCDDRAAAENFMKAYERWSYRKKDGKSEPNWGQFRGKIDNFIGTFEDIVTEREYWAKITPIEMHSSKEKTIDGEDVKINKQRIADKITSEFHELCIRPWMDRDEITRLSLFDMVMFSKGVVMWDSPNGVYPESVPWDRIFPDSRACMNPKKWDMCFVEKVYTAVELYSEIHDESTAQALGWSPKNVRRLLQEIGQLTDTTNGPNGADDGITEGRSNKGGNLFSDPDLKITLVMAYVKEYKPNDDGTQVNLYTFVHNRHAAQQSDKVRGKSGDGNTPIGFLRVHEGIARDLGEVFSLDTHQAARSYYRCPSEAEMIYAACRFYDQGINKVIRAALRNMALMLKSENQDQQEKLKRLEIDEAVVMDPDVDVIQQRVQHDIKPVVEIVRQVMIDTDRSANVDLAAGSQNVKGRAITASEANIQLTESSKSQKKDIRLYVIGEKRKITEMYRRFVSDDTMVEGDEGYKMHKLFKKRMKEAGISPKDYAPENVLVEPVFYNFGDPPEQIVQKAQVRLNALRQLSTSTSPGEQKAIREIVAATSSYADAEEFMAHSQNEGFFNMSIIKAGIENSIMADPYLNRKNIHVLSEDKHFIELPIHIQDVEYKLNNAIGIIENLEGTPEENVPIQLDDATDIVVAMDNQMAHIEAHLTLAERDSSSRGRVKSFREAVRRLQQQEKVIELQLSITQQSRVQSNRERLINDEKLRHLSATNQEHERNQAAKNKLDLGKSLAKMQAALDGQNRKQRQDMQNKQAMHSVDLAKKSIETQEDIRIKQIETEAAQRKAEQTPRNE
jgi:hypothetical protein